MNSRYYIFHLVILTLLGMGCSSESYDTLDVNYQKAVVEYKNENYNAALEILNPLLEQQFEPSYLLGRVYYLRGFIYANDKTWHLAYEDYSQALIAFDHVGKDGMMAMIYNEIGQIFFVHELYDQALHNFEMALKKSGDSSEKNISNFNYGVAKTLAQLGQYDRSLDYFLLAIEIDERLNRIDGLIVDYMAMASMQLKAGNSHLAKKHYYQVIEIITATKSSTKRLVAVNNNIGNIYFRSGDINQAEKYFLKSLALEKEMPNPRSQTYVAYNNLGKVYFEKEQYDLSWYYLKKSIHDNKNKVELNELSITNEVMKRFYKKNQKPDSLLYYTQLINDLALPALQSKEDLRNIHLQNTLVAKFESFQQVQLAKKQQASISWLMVGVMLFVVFSGFLSYKIWNIYHYQPAKAGMSVMKNSDELVFLLDSMKKEKDELKKTISQVKAIKKS